MIDEKEYARISAMLEASQQRAAAAMSALFGMKQRLEQAAKEWERTANGYPVAVQLRALAREVDARWQAEISESNAVDESDVEQQPVDLRKPTKGDYTQAVWNACTEWQKQRGRNPSEIELRKPALEEARNFLDNPQPRLVNQAIKDLNKLRQG